MRKSKAAVNNNVGTTINVAAGTYTENVTIRPNVMQRVIRMAYHPLHRR